jgi:hypothetical protein
MDWTIFAQLFLEVMHHGSQNSWSMSDMNRDVEDQPCTGTVVSSEITFQFSVP